MLDCGPSGNLSEQLSHYAPAGRVDTSEIQKLADRALADPILQVVMQAVGGYAMVLNGHRQIIAATPELLGFLGAKPFDSVLGLRPGEAVGCVNVRRGPDGCGTSVQCRHCGAVTAILAAQASNEPVEDHCSLACGNDRHPRPTEFRIRVTPLMLASERLYVVVFHDVTAAKRREMLERMFLHDLGDLASGLIGWSDELTYTATADAAMQVVQLAQRLGEQLAEQRLLLAFEQGESTLSYAPIDFDGLVADLQTWFGAHECANDRTLAFEKAHLPADFHTDRQLLLRVLVNLVKNAFEATPQLGTVTLRMFSRDQRVVFEIHNVGAMPEDTQIRLFKQRFSTKGPGRGLGTQAVLFFGEQCLGGRVSFESNERDGTVFRFELSSAGN